MSAEYSNPTIPEGINTSERHPLRRFFVQSAQVIGVFAACVLLLTLAASLFAPYVPFSWEQRMAQSIEKAFPAKPDSEAEKALRDLAAKVAARMDLPEGMDIKLRYSETDTVNAIAMPGGLVVVFRGLLEELESEDEVAALLAHEIAHVQHRDVARSMMRAMGMALLLSVVEPVAPVVSLVQRASTMSFSRTQESAADLAAADALTQLYGHAGGAVRLFERMRDLVLDDQDEPPELMASHPNFDNRIASVRERCAALPACAAEGTFTPLPAALVAVREQAKKKTQDDACKD
ncbi:MAG: M48 family metallopeptidase [Ottowia sp.]|nr:M48 family metallopeptidase [Ottowia sp.]